jgi:hypothetical protein
MVHVPFTSTTISQVSVGFFTLAPRRAAISGEGVLVRMVSPPTVFR